MSDGFHKVCDLVQVLKTLGLNSRYQWSVYKNKTQQPTQSGLETPSNGPTCTLGKSQMGKRKPSWTKGLFEEIMAKSAPKLRKGMTYNAKCFTNSPIR